MNFAEITTPAGTTATNEDAAGATFEASVLYAVGDLHQLARRAPPGKAEVIHAAADLLAGLVTTGD